MDVPRCRHRAAAVSGSAGFTLLEIVVVVTLMLIMVGVAVPPLLAAIDHAKLRGSSSNLSGVIQRSRMHAVKRNRSVTVHFLTVGDVQFAVVKDVGDTSTGLG